MKDVELDGISIDVGEVLQRTVTSLYSALITRPTGRAVRMAIETRLQDAGEQSLSLIDLSEVVVLDFSCADEVVARLVERSSESRSHEAFFVFRGVLDAHRDQVQAVLERRRLATVAETEPGVFDLLGERTPSEERVWRAVEERGVLPAEESRALFADPDDRAGLELLTSRRLVFPHAPTASLHSLSRLARKLL